MSVHSQPIHPVPEETARIARLVFPKGNRYMIRLWTNLRVKRAERYVRKDNDGLNQKPRHYRHLHYAYSFD